MSFWILGWLLRQSARFFDAELDLQGFNNALGHLALKGKNISYVAVVIFRPEMVPIGHIDQLSGDPKFISGFAHTAFEHGVHMQLLTDFAKNVVLVFPFESETRCPPRHAQPWYLGQRVN